MDIILNRRSVRNYDLSKKLSYNELYELCKYGESAPTARNQKGREYIIIDDLEIINKHSVISKGALVLTKCNTAIAVIGKNPDLLSTPHMQIEDLSAATQNILLAATMKKLGSWWIGVAPVLERVTLANEILGLKDGAYVFSIITIGYPLDDDCFYEIEKLNSGIVHHNRY